MFQEIILKIFSPLIAGAILTLAFAPFSYWWIACISITLWMFLTQKFPTFQTGFLFGLGMFSTGISWVAVSMTEYGNASYLMATIMVGFFIAGLSVFPGLASLGFTMWSRRWPTPFGQIFLLTACWVTMEAFRSWFLTGFPWLLLGYSALDSPFSGYLSWIGAFGVSCIVAITGGTLLVAFQTKNIKPALVAMLLIGTGISLEMFYKPDQNKDGKTSVALWQPAIPQHIKWKTKHRPEILASHLNDGLPPQTSLIIWPETALPMTEKQMRKELPDLDSLLMNNGQTLISGILGESNGRFTNRLVSLGIGSGTYDKTRLVPFGEYVPLEYFLRGLMEFFNLPMSQIIPGQESELLLHKDLKIAPLICYEIAFTGLARQNSAHANVLLTVSNDTWFGTSIGPDQHLEIAQIRARELGKPIMRATNDGVTALIDPFGRITQQLDRYNRRILYGNITPSNEITPYSKAGEVPVIIFLVVFLTLTRKNESQLI